MKVYFRSVAIARKARDAEGRAIPYKYEYVPPRELEVELPSLDVADALTAPGAVLFDIPAELSVPDSVLNDWKKTRLQLDVSYGYATTEGEILKRDVAWLNDERVWSRGSSLAATAGSLS